MKLDNFKELLLKKTHDNPNLQLLIKYMRDDYLLDHTIESLEKMARSYSNKNPNHAVMHFGTHMDPETEGNMIRDALSHHASHYRAALNSGNEDLADQHMKKIFNIMHMSEKLTRDGANDHSGGKLQIEAIDPKPWERAGYSSKNEKSGKFSTDTKGWSRNAKNYNWLRGAPYNEGSYGRELKAHGHDQAYPLNQIKVNGKYLHIDDVEPTGEFVEHPFDKHPIMSNYSKSPTAHTSEMHQEFLNALDQYHDEGGVMDSYWDAVEAIKDYDLRGAEAPQAIHKPLKEIAVKQAVEPASSKEDAQAKIANILSDKTSEAPKVQQAPAPAAVSQVQPQSQPKPKVEQPKQTIDSADEAKQKLAELEQKYKL